MKKFRTKVFIFNAIIAFICACAIFSYCTLPLWKVTASYHMSAETLSQLFSDSLKEGDQAGDQGGDQGGDSPVSFLITTADESMEGGDGLEGGQGGNESSSSDLTDEEIMDILKDCIPQEGITLELSINLGAKKVFSFLKEDPKASVSAIVEENIDNALDSLSGTIEDIADGVVHATTKVALKTVVTEQINTAVGTEKSKDEINAIMTDAGMSDAYINDKANEIVTLINSKPTVDELADKVVEVAKEFSEKLQTAEELKDKDLTLSDDTTNMIRESVKEMFQSFENAEGEIDKDALFKEFFSMITSKEEPQGGVAPSSTYAEPPTPPETDEKTLEEVIAELKVELHNQIMEKFPDSTLATLAKVMKVFAYVLLFSIITWAYLIVKILIKIGAKNNGIKIKTPIYLGWVPFTVLKLLPTLLVSFITNPPAKIKEILGDSLDVLSGFKMEFETSGTIAFICAIALLVVWVFYRKAKKQLAIAIAAEKMIKEKEKKEEKEKKQAEKEQQEKENIAKAVSEELEKEKKDE